MKDFRKELNELIQDFFGAEFNEGEEFGVTKYNNIEESPLSYDDVEMFRCCVLSKFEEAMKANPVENRVSQAVSQALPEPNLIEAGWISVGDKLPEEMKNILFLMKSYTGPLEYCFGQFGGDNWWVDDSSTDNNGDSMRFTTSEIKYWRELPPKP